jgi:hypothetical protein
MCGGGNTSPHKRENHELLQMPIVRDVPSHEREEATLRDVQLRRADRVDGKNREDKNPEVVEVRDGRNY